MKRRLAALFFIFLVLVLAGCSAAGEQRPSATAASAPSSTSSVQILPTPESIIPLDDRLLATIELQGNPDELLDLDGYIWALTDSGHLYQVDPATNEVTADIQVATTTDHYHYCQGLGMDGENIWACSAADDGDNRTINVVRVDPELKAVVQTFEVNKLFDQLEMPFLAGKIWVLTGTGDKLLAIDVATNEAAAAVDLGARCFRLAVAGDSLFAACGLDDLVLQIDPESGEITKRLAAKSPRYITGDGDALWVIGQDGVLLLDAATLTPRAEWLIRHVSDAFVAGDAAWILLGNGDLYRIDTASNAIVEQIRPVKGLAGASVLATSDSVWVTANDENLLLRISSGD